MSFHSPMTPQTGSRGAAVPPAEPVAPRVSADTDESLAWWGVVIDEKLKAVRRTLAVKLANMEPSEQDCAPSTYADALAECDAIAASAARLIIPPQPAGDSFLGHLVAELEAAVALADRKARIAALAAHKARLEELMMCDGADAEGGRAAKS
jgi:arachidonate 15-lipoxygenase